MHMRNEDIDTVSLHLEDHAARPRIQTDAVTFARAVANFFRKDGSAGASESMAAEIASAPPSAELTQCAQATSMAIFYKHWNAIKAEGITASQFIAFLQPLADLDGIAVSYALSDEDGKRHVYNHRPEDLSQESPLSRAIRERTISREKALTFALNEEGKVWIESNFIELR